MILAETYLLIMNRVFCAMLYLDLPSFLNFSDRFSLYRSVTDCCRKIGGLDKIFVCKKGSL
jgi:hypothetical protein